MGTAQRSPPHHAKSNPTTRAVFNVTTERAGRAKLLKWLVGALAALVFVSGLAFGVLAVKGGKSKPPAARAVLGVQVGGPNAGNGSANAGDCSTDPKPNGKMPPCPKSFNLSGTITGLYPGATLNLPVLVTNQNSIDIKVRDQDRSDGIQQDRVRGELSQSHPIELHGSGVSCPSPFIADHFVADHDAPRRGERMSGRHLHAEVHR